MRDVKEKIKTIVTKASLTQEEITERLLQIKQMREEIINLLLNIKELRTNVKAKQEAINKLIEEVCNGKAEKEIEAKIIIDYDSYKKTILNNETGEIISEEELNPEDLQEELFEDDNI